MNSNIQALVKLEYVHDTARELLSRPDMREVFPTLSWIRTETVSVMRAILDEAKDRKQYRSWKRVAELGFQQMRRRIIGNGILDKYRDVCEQEASLFMISVCTQILDDLLYIKGQEERVKALHMAALTVENLIHITKKPTYDEDALRAIAGEYLDHIYGALAEV